jgi:CheY-like chemotaxis protein/HAMP domain-containing protein
MDFKTKLAFALVTASLLSMGALGYFTHLWAESSFVADSQRQLSAFADDARGDVDAVLEHWTREVRDVVESARTSESIPRDPDVAEANPIDEVTRVLREAEARSDEIRRLTLLELEGVDTTDRPVIDPVPITDSGDENIFFTGARIEADDRIGFVFHAWITRDGIRLGLLEAVFDAGVLAALLGHTPDVGETGETLLLIPTTTGSASLETEREGYFLLGSTDRPNEPLESADAPPAISAALAGRQETFADVPDRGGRKMLAATRAMADTGWGIVVQLEAAEARDRADQLLSNMRTLGISLAAFAILGGTLFGFYLAAPINRLVEAVDRIRHGELGLRLEVNGEDEVAFLAQSLNEFLEQLHRSSDLFRLGELNVLVVCDDHKERELLKDLLKSWNMRPVLADNGASALAVFEQASQAGQLPQLVLLDDGLPDTERDRLIAQLRTAHSARLPVILLSSTLENLDPVELATAGIGRTLPKPVVASHLMEAILDEMGVSTEGLAPSADVFLKKTTPRKILLAEDNGLIQQVMLEFLGNWGHVVTLADDGKKALQCVQSERFDLILMDIEMPNMNGIEATAAIRAHEEEGDWKTPIIALTAESLSGARERFLAAGMDDYIAKPADPKALYALINRYPARVLASNGSAPATHPPSQDSIQNANEDEEMTVDWKTALAFTNGDENLLRELIETFSTESSEQLAAMRRGIVEGDAELLARSAHTLKSSARLLGADRLAEVSLSMEMLGRTGTLEGARSLLDSLAIHLNRLKIVLAEGPEHEDSQT